jgi:FkbM family methyltransferase
MERDLIVDVGMHMGLDSEFYLAKGFRVVAIEAHPGLVATASSRLCAYIADGRLKIYPVAVQERDGECEFYTNQEKTDWGTACRSMAEHPIRAGTHHRKIMVRCMTLDQILAQCGIPYYLKIDIEGADGLCLEALKRCPDRPAYVSVETQASIGEAIDQLLALCTLGYRRFSIVDQSNHVNVRCPNPPLEGRYVDARFNGHTSGLFGRELPGPWLDFGAAVRRLRIIYAWKWLFGAGGTLYRTPFRRAHDRWRRMVHRRRILDEWFDVHARLE